MKQCHSVIDSSPIALGSHGGVRSGAELVAAADGRRLFVSGSSQRTQRRPLLSWVVRRQTSNNEIAMRARTSFVALVTFHCTVAACATANADIGGWPGSRSETPAV